MEIQDDEIFGYDKERFMRDFWPVYQELGSSPNYVVQFPIVLPFQLPFDHGMCNTMKLEDGALLTFHYTDVMYDNNVWAGANNIIAIPDSKLTRTRVIMNYVSTQKIDDEETDLSELFDVLLDSLNIVILSYMIIKKDVSIYKISREMLEFLTLHRLVTIDPWETTTGIFMLNQNISASKEKLPITEQKNITWFAGIVAHNLNPFINSEELMMTARRNLNFGFYREAIIFSQTSIETYLSTLYSLMLSIDGHHTDQIDQIIDKTPFMTMVKREFQVRLGGTWDINKTESEVGSWYINTYKLRNKVVHAGFIPLFDEATKAFQDANSLRVYILGLIKKSKKYSVLNELLYVRGPVEE